MDIDKVVLLRGKPIIICEGVTLNQPTLGEITDFGEAKFFNTFWTLCSSPWDMPSVLDDMGIDFMKISEWELFRSIAIGLTTDKTSPIFGDLDFSKMRPMMRTNEDGSTEIVLYNASSGLIIDETIYKAFIPIVRESIGFVHSGKKAGNEATRKLLIWDDKKARKRNTNKAYESVLYNGIISLVNTEEFKYNYESVFDITLFQFTKSLTQIQGKKAACALMQGSMSGFCDSSKIQQRDFQWTYSEDKYKSRGHKLFKGDSQAIKQAGATK